MVFRSELPLHVIFDQVNQKHFEGCLDPPTLRWNERLRTSAGRFIPGSRRVLEHQPVIEMASYLMQEPRASTLLLDTMGHEMIHYWLWIRRRPYGHTPEFYEKMEKMGVSRYNSVPRATPYKYLYRCANCREEFKAKRRLRPLACAKCCKQHSGGYYDARFKLVLEETLSD